MRRVLCPCAVIRYIAMGVAAECKELCRGVVLVNSAGKYVCLHVSTEGAIHDLLSTPIAECIIF